MPEYLSEGDFLTDKYQIEKILHTDEEGAIYRCKFRRSVVILKQIFSDPSLSSKEKEKLGDAFSKRCDSIKKLQHNSITVIEDFFIYDDNNYYIAMELIPGKSLEELYLEEYNKTFPLDLLLKYMSSVCESIIYVNKQKVPLVHGNLCPSSIMVGISGDIKLVNFGLKNISMTGKNTGSPIYSSPEQINNKNIDFKTDIFAVGAIIYYFLSGKNFRFDDNNVKLSQCKPPVSKNLDELVMACLSQDPSKRPDLQNLSRQLSKLYLSESVRKATRPVIPLPVPQQKKPEEKKDEKPSIPKISIPAPSKEVKKVEERQEKPSIPKISIPVKLSLIHI